MPPGSLHSARGLLRSVSRSARSPFGPRRPSIRRQSMSSRLWRAAAILVPSLLLAGLAAAGSAAATPAPPGLVTSNFACTNGVCELGPGNVGLSFAAGLNGTGGPPYYGPDCPY